MKLQKNIARETPFFEFFFEEVKKHGGMHNAHLHMDRTGTYEERYQKALGFHIFDASYISLQEKHKRIYDVHAGPAYVKEDLQERVNFYLDVMVGTGTTRADTMVDVTNDCVGLSALEALLEIKHARKDEIDFQLASYSPLGFRDDQPERWDVFAKGAEIADFIGLLPEADDLVDYPDHIGFSEHIRRGLDLAKQVDKPVHVHTDQRVDPFEDATEQLIEAVKKYGAPEMDNGEPSVWAVHAISPTTYDEARFERYVAGLKESNVGIICCPSAALGMRQMRRLQTPQDNSMPRVLEMLAAGVHVRIASDNIADICSPTTTADLTDEVIVLSAALRFYHPTILAKIAAGVVMNDEDRGIIQEHLEKNAHEADKRMKKLNLG